MGKSSGLLKAAGHALVSSQALGLLLLKRGGGGSSLPPIPPGTAASPDTLEHNRLHGKSISWLQEDPSCRASPNSQRPTKPPGVPQMLPTSGSGKDEHRAGYRQGGSSGGFPSWSVLALGRSVFGSAREARDVTPASCQCRNPFPRAGPGKPPGKSLGRRGQSPRRQGASSRQGFACAGRGSAGDPRGGQGSVPAGTEQTPQVSSAAGMRERDCPLSPPRRVIFKACFPATFKWHLPAPPHPATLG